MTERVGDLRSLDSPAATFGAVVQRLVPSRSRRKDLLSGTWLGHPLHPLLTDVPIGSFTSATVLDLVGGVRAHRSADRLVDLGLVSSVITAAAGAADWSDTTGRPRRVGVVHAATNVAGVALYAASALARRRHRRALATALGLGGMTVMSAAGYLGGHLVFTNGVGVNANADATGPAEWTDATARSAVTDGATHAASIDGTDVLLYRCGGRVRAIGDRCSHAGGPLHESTLDHLACTVTCPWHGSVFDLRDGSVIHGPATVPQPAYDTRVVGDRVEVRGTEPGGIGRITF